MGSTQGFVGTLSSHPFGFFTGALKRGEFSTNGNFILQNGGTFSDGGQRLQVIGDAFIKGSGATDATIALQVQNSSSTNLLRVRNDSVLFTPHIIYVGQNTTNTLIYAFDGNANTSPSASGRNFGIFNGNTTQTGDQSHFALVGNSLTPTSGDTNGVLFQRTFAPTSGTATFKAFNINPTINQTGGANGITRGLYVNPTLTAAADWRSIEWSNNSGWGLYGAGTANNYLGGRLSIATTNTPRRLNIEQANGSTAASIGLYSSGTLVSVIGIDTASTTDLQIATAQSIRFYASSTIGNIVTEPTNERMRLTAAGRLLLGTTTESTFALDVNGTARVSGAVNLATSSGNVGIGVTGGVLKLDVQGNAADTTTVGGVTVEQVTLFRPSNGVGGIRSGFNTTTGHAYIWSSTSGGNLNFGTRSAPDNNVGMTLTFGGNLLVGTTADIASSKVTISSTTQGFLPPRMTTTQKNAIGTPAQGLMVFDTTLVKLCVYNGTTWETITSV